MRHALKAKLIKLYSEYFSLIFVPDNGKPFFEIKFKKLYVYIFIFVLISTSIYSVIMTDTTTSLYSLLTTKIVRANTLVHATEKQKIRIDNLEQEFEKIDERIVYLSQLDHNIRSMVGLTDAKDTIAGLTSSTDRMVEISRSADRSFQFQMENNQKSLNPTLGQVQEAQTINSQLDSKIDEMNLLIEEVEERLTYLSCYPDKWPTYGRISSRFGYRIHPISRKRDFHTGIDIANSSGTLIYAAGNGKVIYSGYKNGYGRTIMIDHGYGYVTVYAHNRTLLAEKGDTVKKGEKIAKMGRTGTSTGNHLHFEVRKYGTQINPMKTLK